MATKAKKWCMKCKTRHLMTTPHDAPVRTRECDSYCDPGATGEHTAGCASRAPTSVDAQTKTTTHDDGKFVRTALVVGEACVGSVALVDSNGQRVALVNIVYRDEHLIVDTIDVDKRFSHGRALTFGKGDRREIDIPTGGNLVSADFQGASKAEG